VQQPERLTEAESRAAHGHGSYWNLASFKRRLGQRVAQFCVVVDDA